MTEADVNAFERELGAPLPGDYRGVLLEVAPVPEEELPPHTVISAWIDPDFERELNERGER